MSNNPNIDDLINDIDVEDDFSQFTPEQAFEQSEDGQPIFITGERAAQIIEEHSDDATAFWVEFPQYTYSNQIDAAHVFAFLGY